jgi:predicted GNAT family acetyltransferase
MADVRLERPPDVTAFIDGAGAFLGAREAENCLMLGIAASIAAGDYTDAYFAIIRKGADIAGVALRTPPFNILLSVPFATEAMPTLVEDLAVVAPDLTGVGAEVSEAEAFAGLWAARMGVTARHHMAERVFRLDQVAPPRSVGGAMREARPGDRPIIASWLRAFALEALGERTDETSAGRVADRWIAARGRRMHLWIDGRPTSLVGVSGETPHGIRVAPVYTPPELRGRGYASALTAAVSQAQLDAGRRSCFLFTDLANPTSNQIYRSIGYEPVCDVDDLRFGEPAAADT